MNETQDYTPQDASRNQEYQQQPVENSQQAYTQQPVQNFQQAYTQQSVPGYPTGQVSPKSHIVAALLQFFLGGLGIGNFYAGYTLRGGIQLGLTLVAFVLDFFFIGFIVHFIVGIWAFVETILYLLKTGSYAYDGNRLPFA